VLSRLPFRLPRILLVVTLLIAMAATGVVLEQRAASQAASEDEQRQARAQVASDVGELRRSMASPAHDAKRALAALRINLAEHVTGSERDLEQIEQDREVLITALRTAADDLDDSSDLADRDLDADLPVDTLESVAQRLEGLDEQARWVAAQLRVSADEAERWGETAGALRGATEELIALDLPSTQDPEALAQRWREEAEMLEPYREAAEAAVERDDLEVLGEAHLQLVDGLEELAADAVDKLGDGDVDGYNDLLDERLGDDDPFGFRAALDDAVTESLRSGPIGEVEEAQERTLGLLVELEELRRSTPARSAA
jgi:type II secretory pathway pseudopilin PulG